ncbi:MAG: hypothetical protein PHS53_01555 [Candidatus Pacebacteria bacterium]|nr:hypothetical protein [Candidatus Paceibacterota bacterium]MDD5356815.1 hypothetical protein [Candidatus Paceibacterota bacterium]
MNRPSNKIIILLVIAILVVGGAFFFKNFDWTKIRNPFASKTETQNQNLQVLAENEINKDSDQDGLKDWEEKLWKTDPSSSDTDKDGTSDGEEVKEGRDPKLAGPNDKISKDAAIQKIIQSSETENLNPTEKLSREFLAQYLGTNPSGGTLTDAEKNALIGNLTAESITPFTYKRHSASELKVLPDGSAETIRAYGNILGKIIVLNTKIKLESETTILQSALAGEDKEKLKELDPIIARYTTIVSQGMKISVPPTAAELHIHFMNALTDLAESASRMKVVFEDPLTTLKSLSAYSEAETELTTSIADLQDYFSKNGVVFNKNEYGYTFRPTQ